MPVLRYVSEGEQPKQLFLPKSSILISVGRLLAHFLICAFSILWHFVILVFVVIARICLIWTFPIYHGGKNKYQLDSLGYDRLTGEASRFGEFAAKVGRKENL